MKWLRRFNENNSNLYREIDWDILKKKVGYDRNVFGGNGPITWTNLCNFTPYEYKKITEIFFEYTIKGKKFIISDPNFKGESKYKSLSVTHRKGEIHIIFYKIRDDYFIISLQKLDFEYEYYECDQIDGVLELLNDKILSDTIFDKAKDIIK